MIDRNLPHHERIIDALSTIAALALAAYMFAMALTV